MDLLLWQANYQLVTAIIDAHKYTERTQKGNHVTKELCLSLRAGESTVSTEREKKAANFVVQLLPPPPCEIQ